MSTRVFLTVLLLAAAGAPVAVAQTGAPATASDRPPHTTLPAPVGIDELAPSSSPQRQAAATPRREGGLNPVATGVPGVEDRMDPQQTQDELVKTSLLNRFGGLGFSQLRSFGRSGDLYVAEVMTRDHQWVEIEIDPATGAVSLRP